MYKVTTKRADSIVKTLIWIVYSIIVVFLSVYHEPWNDELVAWYISATNTPAGVIGMMAEEGHFCIWHFLLYPLVQLGMSCTVGLPLVSCSLMILAAWLFIYRSPIGLWSIVFVLFSFPALYYFPVVSRVYALIPLVLWLIANYYPKRMERPLLYGLLIGLLINTHIYMEGLALGLLVCWAIDIKKIPVGQRKTAWIGFAVSIVLGVFALCQVVGNLFIETSPAGEAAESFRVWMGRIVEAKLSILNYVPRLHSVYRVGLVILVAMYIWYCFMMRHQKRLLLIITIAALFQIFFALFVYNGLFQRRYLIYFIMVFGFWIGRCRGLQPTLWLLIYLLGNLPLEIKDITADLKYRYANESYVSEMIKHDPNTVKYINIDNKSMQYIINCFGKPSLQHKEYMDEAEMLRQVYSEQPDSLLVCRVIHILEENVDSCNTVQIEALRKIGYDLTGSSREDVFYGTAYLNSYKRIQNQ